MSNSFEYTWEEAVTWLRNQPDKQGLVRDCFYDDPLDESAKRYSDSSEWSAVKNILSGRRKGKVLDVGAGRGISSYAFAKEGWEVTALEPDNSKVVGIGAIEQLIQPQMKIDIVQDFAERIPFANETFDLVYGRAVLHHANDLTAFLAEVSRVLKRNGLFLFTREHVLSHSQDLESFLANHPLHCLYGGENAYELLVYTKAIEDSGMRCDSVLQPYDSDINLFPVSQQDLFQRIRGRTRIPWPNWIIRRLFFPVMNLRNNNPGRLYSFVGGKL